MVYYHVTWLEGIRKIGYSNLVPPYRLSYMLLLCRSVGQYVLTSVIADGIIMCNAFFCSLLSGYVSLWGSVFLKTAWKKWEYAEKSHSLLFPYLSYTLFPFTLPYIIPHFLISVAELDYSEKRQVCIIFNSIIIVDVVFIRVNIIK